MRVYVVVVPANGVWGRGGGSERGGEEEEKNGKENSKRAPERNADSLLQIQ